MTTSMLNNTRAPHAQMGIDIEGNTMSKLLFQPSVHDLKTWSGYFWQVQRGVKQFELRKNDREYQAGDILILRDYDQEADRLTGHALIAVVTCVVDDATFLQPGCVALGIQVL